MEDKRPADGKAIASLVLGIVSFICIFFGYGAILGIVLAIVGLILGMDSKKRNPSGMATAGVVLSIISIIIIGEAVAKCISRDYFSVIYNTTALFMYKKILQNSYTVLMEGINAT